MDLGNTISLLYVVLGVGLIIFVHELGHFLVAKKVGIRVETFSLGFGPRLFGFRHGDTDYRVSIMPLGGYVKMAGETPGEVVTGSDDEFSSKTVGQRMAVIVAGVVMNVIFAFIAFPIVFTAGVPFEENRVGHVWPGSAAWEADLRPGDLIHEIDGKELRGFPDIRMEVALSDAEEGIDLTVHRPSGDGVEILQKRLYPKFDPTEGIYAIGIAPALESKDGHVQVTVEDDSPAFRAGLKTGDALMSVNGEPVDASTYYSDSSRLFPSEQSASFVVDRGGERIEATIEPELSDLDAWRVGVTPFQNVLTGIRHEKLRKLGVDASRLQVGDKIVGALGQEIHQASDLRRILGEDEVSGIQLRVQRKGEGLDIPVSFSNDLDYDAFLDQLSFGDAADSSGVLVREGYPAAAVGIQNGDRIVKIGRSDISDFEDVVEAVTASSGEKLDIEVQRAGVEGTLSFSITPAQIQAPDYGIQIHFAQVVRQYSFVESIAVGFDCSLNMIKNLYLTLKKIFAGDVASKNLGGIITIGVVSYSFAESGAAKLFYFLAILSLNLAFLNILPIPVLDGGHFLFLIIEKLKGSPVSERVLGYSQVAGLIIILALMLYVTYNDIQRWILN
ncbi:MAG: RIP metalloprotease RseP [Planctomycetota bacterium]